jgi:hypothetical protein
MKGPKPEHLVSLTGYDLFLADKMRKALAMGEDKGVSPFRGPTYDVAYFGENADGRLYEGESDWADSVGDGIKLGERGKHLLYVVFRVDGPWGDERVAVVHVGGRLVEAAKN